MLIHDAEPTNFEMAETGRFFVPLSLCLFLCVSVLQAQCSKLCYYHHNCQRFSLYVRVNVSKNIRTQPTQKDKDTQTIT